MTRELGAVGVVGLGTMGAGIAEVFARAGLAVVGVETDDAALARGRGHLERSVSRAVERGRLAAEEGREVLGRVQTSTALDDLADVDLVVEAVPEVLSDKTALFGGLHTVCRPDTVFATNTSSLSVTEIAAASGRPGRVVGMHFFNPAPVLALVEVVHTVLSDDDAVQTVRSLATSVGKSPVVVGDRAGFIVNALLFGYLNEAVALLESGGAEVTDIETAMTHGAGLPMGPFALLDLIGLDTSLHILEALHGATAERRHAPSPLLRQLVAAGRLGRKTGAGFVVSGTSAGEAQPAAAGDPAGVLRRVHRRPGSPVLEIAVEAGADPATLAAERAAAAALAGEGEQVVAGRERPGGVLDRLLFPYLNDAVRMVESGYASAADIDLAMRAGCGYPVGPLAHLDAVGTEEAVEALDGLHAAYGEPSYVPVPLLRSAAASGRFLSEPSG